MGPLHGHVFLMYKLGDYDDHICISVMCQFFVTTAEREGNKCSFYLHITCSIVFSRGMPIFRDHDGV